MDQSGTGLDLGLRLFDNDRTSHGSEWYWVESRFKAFFITVVSTMVKSGSGLDLGLRLFDKGRTYHGPERF